MWPNERYDGAHPTSRLNEHRLLFHHVRSISKPVINSIFPFGRASVTLKNQTDLRWLSAWSMISAFQFGDIPWWNLSTVKQEESFRSSDLPRLTVTWSIHTSSAHLESCPAASPLFQSTLSKLPYPPDLGAFYDRKMHHPKDMPLWRGNWAFWLPWILLLGSIGHGTSLCGGATTGTEIWSILRLEICRNVPPECLRRYKPWCFTSFSIGKETEKKRNLCRQLQSLHAWDRVVVAWLVLVVLYLFCIPHIGPFAQIWSQFEQFCTQ